MKNHLRKTISSTVLFLGLSLPALAAPPPRVVSLVCSPLPYTFSCSIPRMANPEFDTRCWYRTNGQGYLMRSDRRLGFYNDIVELKIRDSLRVTGQVRDLRTGRVASCTQSSSDYPYWTDEFETDFYDEGIEIPAED